MDSPYLHTLIYCGVIQLTIIQIIQVVIHAVCMQFLSAYKCDFSEQSFLVGYA
jgi:hypothetical protein